MKSRCQLRVAALCVAWLLWGSEAGRAAELEPRLFFGMCDASAVVMLNEDRMLVANDEDNLLRVYSIEVGGMPVFTHNVARFLGFKKGGGESDIEAVARVGDRVYWITSHGRNAEGKRRPKRQRFFATTAGQGSLGDDIRPVGRAYERLLNDLMADRRLARFELGKASLSAPKEEGALNIEGLAATEDGTLLIGFRNPIPEGGALIVPLLNPEALLAGGRARFGEPVLVDLGGMGIRGITRWRDRYLILAGPADGKGESRLYEWRGVGRAARWIQEVDFRGMTPEGITGLGSAEEGRFLVLSDDGTVLCDGVECKKLKDPAKKRFRMAEFKLKWSE